MLMKKTTSKEYSNGPMISFYSYTLPTLLQVDDQYCAPPEEGSSNNKKVS